MKQYTNINFPSFFNPFSKAIDSLVFRACLPLQFQVCFLSLFQYYNRVEETLAMGCSSSILQPQKPPACETHNRKETAYIEIIIPSPQPQRSSESDAEGELLNTKMKKQKEKIQYLQHSQDFMKESVEISNQVQQALLSLTYNPLLHDEAYYKLIGLNKKTLERKQNRMNNLLKRESQAELELKKEKERKMDKTKSQLINYRLTAKKKKTKNKENRQQSGYNYFSQKESFTAKMSRVQLYLLETPSQ